MDERLISSQPDLPPEVVDALSRGRKIEAIKLLREAHDIDLKSARDIVDHYEKTHAVPKGQDVSGMITQDRTNITLIWIAVLAAAAAAAYFYFG